MDNKNIQSENKTEGNNGTINFWKQEVIHHKDDLPPCNFDDFINKIISIHEDSVFSLGELNITDSVRDVCEVHNLDITDYLYLHATGNFGEIQQHGQVFNEESLKTSFGRFFSRYVLELSDSDFLELNIITNTDRGSTSVVLPHELVLLN